jgi:hypothetical protein
MATQTDQKDQKKKQVSELKELSKKFDDGAKVKQKEVRCVVRVSVACRDAFGARVVAVDQPEKGAQSEGGHAQGQVERSAVVACSCACVHA